MRAPPPPAIVSKAPIYRPLVILSTLDLPSMLWGRPRAAQQPTGSGLQFWPVPVPPPRVPVVDDRTQEAQLAFASARDRAQGQEACEAKVLKGCTAGLRAACSVQAARQCGPPPLLRLLGLTPEQAWEEREACEARCMAACLEQRTPGCQQHAEAFCTDAFAGPAAGGDLRLLGSSSSGSSKKR